MSHALVPSTATAAAECTARVAEVQRNTAETKVYVHVDLDGTGKARLATGIGFLDHMLDQIARHGLIDLNIDCEGDLHVTATTPWKYGITLGQAFAKAVGDKRAFAATAMPTCRWMRRSPRGHRLLGPPRSAHGLQVHRRPHWRAGHATGV